MNKKIVLVGAGSTMFGPSMLMDIFLSDVLEGSTIMLHDIDGEKLEIIYELILAENEKRGNTFVIERSTNRATAFKSTDFIINSIEVGDRFKLWWQDYEIPRKHGSTQIIGECGGPGGSFHAWRIIPPIVEIVKDADRICPNAFFINYSNPMSRICLAIKRTAPNLKFIGLCHQISFFNKHIPEMLNKNLKDLKMTVVGLNHFGFLIDLEDLKTGKNLMSKFNSNAMDYFTQHEDRFVFSKLTFEVYKKFGYFPHSGDNHLGEYLQFGEEFTETQDMIDWINLNDQLGKGIYERVVRMHKRLKKGKYPKKGMLPKISSGERAIPIIEAILTDKNSYESSVNIPNNGLIDNLPQDLVLEGPITVNKEGFKGVRIGNIPKQIAALLRIEATIQDLCVEAVLKKSKELALACLAIDTTVERFETAENIFNEMIEVQKEYLPNFK
ncbi:MAG: glycosyl hydrolase family 4 [Promethearchaeota archaeon]